MEFIWVYLGYIKIVICNHHPPDLYFQLFLSRSDSILGPIIGAHPVSSPDQCPVFSVQGNPPSWLKEVPP